jgi:hypothetical protein
MKILAIEKENPGYTAADMRALLKAEASKVWELRHRRIITEIYFTREHHTAVLVLDCPDSETAQSYLRELPLVSSGFIRFELLTLESYSGFSRLFDEGHVAASLRLSWSKITSSKWRPEKPETGQCSVTALVLHDLFGGEILKTRVRNLWHFYNRINGDIHDFTCSQFVQPIEHEHIQATWEEAMDDSSPFQFHALKTSFESHYFSV